MAKDHYDTVNTHDNRASDSGKRGDQNSIVIKPKALTVHDAVRYSSLSKSTLQRLRAAGELLPVKLGARLAWLTADIDAYIDACAKNRSAADDDNATGGMDNDHA